jgi:hypothetical protein
MWAAAAAKLPVGVPAWWAGVVAAVVVLLLGESESRR